METILVFVLAVGFAVSIAANVYQSILRSRDAKEFLEANNKSNGLIIDMHNQQMSDMVQKFRELEELALIDAGEKKTWLNIADRRQKVVDRKYEEVDPKALLGPDNSGDAEYFYGTTRGMPHDEEPN